MKEGSSFSGGGSGGSEKSPAGKGQGFAVPPYVFLMSLWGLTSARVKGREQWGRVEWVLQKVVTASEELQVAD